MIDAAFVCFSRNGEIVRALGSRSGGEKTRTRVRHLVGAWRRLRDRRFSAPTVNGATSLDACECSNTGRIATISDRAYAADDFNQNKQELAMNANVTLDPADFAPVEFMISLDPDRSFIVREGRGRSSGVFAELSSAILFVRESCRALGCPTILRFDRSVACIRAAG